MEQRSPQNEKKSAPEARSGSIWNKVRSGFSAFGRKVGAAAKAVGAFFAGCAKKTAAFFRQQKEKFKQNSEVKKARKTEQKAQKAAVRAQVESVKRQAEEFPAESTVVFDARELKEMDTSEKKKSHERPHLDESQLHSKAHSGKPASLFKKRDRRPNFVIGTILSIVKLSFAALIVLIAVGIGAVFGLANAYLGTTPDLNMDQISDQALTSYIYDCNGDLITTYAGLENREYASLDEIPDMLQKATIAVEDIRFYSHSGIDLKRLLGAFVSNMSDSSVSGGSTITQQLIKNKILSSERSYKRKIQEASLAMELETKYSKDQILEAYLNTIPLGGTNYGVKAAARDYFNKSLDELTLKECACLAGVTQFPYVLNPRRAYYIHPETRSRLDDRISTVLNRMYTAGYITLEEKEAAMAEELHVVEKSSAEDMYPMPHFVEYATYNVVSKLLEQRGLEDNTQNRAATENELRSKGYRIYTTVDPVIQNTVQETFAEYTKYPKMRSSQYNKKTETLSDGTVLETIYPQAATVVLEQSTGQIKALVGSRTTPTIKKSTNRAYTSRMPIGSSIKPIGVYGPAFEKGAGLGTVVANIPAPIKGWNTGAGYPKTSQGTYGPVTVRRGIKSSLNIVASRLLAEFVGVEDSYNYLVELGLNPSTLNKDIVGLALGSSGVSMLELTGAYACIANGGEYKEPLAFTRVEDPNGNIVLDAENVRTVKRVFKKSTAYMLVEAMKTGVQNGTGTRARIKGMTVAGKTGTVQKNKGVVFSGITPYYCSAVWIGHDQFQSLANGDAGRWAAPLWKEYMSKLVEGKEDREILPGKASDYDVTNYSVCAVSGMKATASCPTTSDLFAVGTAPKEKCNVHTQANVCSESGQLASEYCPAELVTSGSVVHFPEDSPYLALSPKMLKSLFPNIWLGDDTQTCEIHTAEWAENYQRVQAAMANGQTAINAANDLKSREADYLTSAQNSLLNTHIARLQELMKADQPSAEAIDAAASTLLGTVNDIKEQVKKAKETPPTPSPSPTPSSAPPQPSPSAAPEP